MPTAIGPTTTSNNPSATRAPRLTSVAEIALDYTPAYEQGGGIGRYVRELTAALARSPSSHRYRLFVAGAAFRDLPPPPAAQFAWRPTRLTPRWLARIWHRARFPLPVECFTGSIALFHATDFVLPPTLPRTRTLLTVHDLSFVRVPETSPPRLKAYLDVVVPRSVARADHVLADSEATKRDLVELYDTPPDKITVLLSGVDARFHPVRNLAALDAVRQKYHLPDRPFILSVGTVQPRKNYARLIHALALLRSRGHEVDLVIAGGKGWLDDPIYDALRDARMTDFVHFIGFAHDDDLPALYSAAACVAVPSLYEGFGIPVLEGMACGTPVLTSTVSSLPEVAGNAALTIPPDDIAAIAEGLERLLTEEHLRQTLVSRGLERAQTFTWERAAAQLLEVYDQLLSGKL